MTPQEAALAEKEILREEAQVEKFRTESAQRQRAREYRARGIEHDRDIGGRIYPIDSDKNRALGIAGLYPDNDGRVHDQTLAQVEPTVLAIKPREVETPELRAVKEKRTQLNLAERTQKLALQKFDRDNVADVEFDPKTGEAVGGNLVNRLGELQKVASQKVGLFEGLFSDASSGDLTPEAAKASEELKSVTENLEARRQQRQRLAEEHQRIKIARDEASLAYGSQMLTQYGMLPADLEPEVQTALIPPAEKKAQQLVAEGLAKPEQVGTITGIINSAQNAFNSSRQALMAANGLDENDAAEIARIEFEKAARKSAPGYDAYQKAEGWGAVRAFLANPIEVTTNIVAEGLIGSLPILAAGYGAGTAGAGIGGAAGTVIPGAGNAVGAGAGFTVGMVIGTGAGSFAVEYGSKILEELQHAGMDMQKPESIAEFFSNEALLDQAKAKAVARGVPVAAFDALSAGIAGRVGSIVKSAAKTKLREGVAEAVIQGAAGGAGEVAGALAAGDEIDGKAVFGEVVGELGPGAAEIAAGKVASKVGGKAEPAPATAASDPFTAPAANNVAVASDEADPFTPVMDDDLAAEINQPVGMEAVQAAETENAPATPTPLSQEPTVEDAADPFVNSTEQKPAPTGSTPAPAVNSTPETLEGDKINREWTAYAPESQSLNIPRAEMPQIASEARGALTQFLKARGIAHASEERLPGNLKPTQAEFSPAKVAKAVANRKEFGGQGRAILVSSDDHVVDGHHQWMAALESAPTEPMKVIRLNAPIRQLLGQIAEFPSAENASGATKTNLPKPSPAKTTEARLPSGGVEAPAPITQPPAATSDKPQERPATPAPAPAAGKILKSKDGEELNRSGVFVRERTPDFAFKTKGAEANVRTVELESGEFALGMNYSHKTGNMQGSGYAPSVSNATRFKTKDEAIRTGLNQIIEENERIVASKSNDTTPQQKVNARALADQAKKALASLGKSVAAATSTEAKNSNGGTASAPTIARGKNTPAEFAKKLTAAAGLKGSDNASRFLVEFARRVHAAAPAEFEKMEVQVLTDAQWKADARLGAQTPDSRAAYDTQTNTLYIHAEKSAGANIVEAVVHEAGHFAERFALGEDFTQAQWESLTDAQREAAARQYDPNNVDHGEDLKNDARARAEWVAMQFARVVRGDSAGMNAQLKAKLEKFLTAVRELVNKWLGSGKLTTPELDARILALMFPERASKKASQQQPQTPSIPTKGTAESPGKSQVAASKETVVSSKKKGKRISVGLPANDTPDILNAIEELGGIASPSQSSNPGGEYDGFAETMRLGAARLLVRKERGSKPDQIFEELKEQGYKFNSVDQMYQAIADAVANRRKVSKSTGREAYESRFEQAFLANENPRAYLRAGQQITVDDLVVGDEFTVNGEKFKVIALDEDGNVTIKDGVTKTLEPGTPVYPDRGEVKRVDRPTDVSFDLEQPNPEVLEAEKAAKKKREDAAKLAEAVEKPLKGDEGDRTKDMFGGGDMALFDAAEPSAPAKAQKFDAKLKQQARDAFDGLLGTPADARFDENIPADRAGKFLPLAQQLVSQGVNTPERVAQFLEETFAGRARKFSQSLWNFLSFADTTLTGRQDWAAVYHSIDTPPAADTVQSKPVPADESTARTNLERDRAGATAPDGGRTADVRTAGERTGGGGRAVGERADGRAEQGRTGNSAGDAPAPGTGSDSVIPERLAGAVGPEAGTARGEQPAGSGGTRGERALDESGADTAAPAAPTKQPAADVVADVRESTLADRVVEQGRAESVDVVIADRENIAKTLPVLLPEQQDDVFKAERRFYEAGGRGMLFTNGTGTGKTFTGLGVIKRFVRRGAKNILIVVPSSKKAIDWQEDGQHLLLDITPLEGVADPGRGIAVTTYANFRMNDALAARDFDLVVYDESHKLMENAQGESTAGDQQHRWVTNHPSDVERKATERVIGPMPDKSKYAGEGFEYANAPDYDTDVANWFKARDRNKGFIAAEVARIKNLTKVVFLSATPFAYHKTLSYADGYLFQSSDRQSNGYNVAQGFDQFLQENFGYRMRYNKLTQPEADVNMDVMERAFADRMMKEGAMSGRSIDVPYDYSREFILLDAGIGAEIDRGIGILTGWIDKEQNDFKTLHDVVRNRFNYIYTMQLMESVKVAQSIDRIRKHIAAGRKVILFHDYNNANPQHPFRNLETLAKDAGQKKEIDAFEARYPELVNLDMGILMNPRRLLEREFGEQAVFFNGEVPSAKRQKNVKAFNSDDSVVKLLVAQSDAMAEGVDAHDTTGKHQRVVMNVGLPVKPTKAIQEEGRAYRVGVKSNAIYEYMVIHTSSEKYAFGSKINERVRTAENLALGSRARTLQDSFKQGYLNPSNLAPGENQGRGGKESDRSNNTMTDFERAKSFYFGRQKKTSKTKSAEGVDYFATPEPIGLTMAEWGKPRPNDKMLEPSAGHGAIARFFPTFTKNTYVEPSFPLAEELRIKVSSGETEITTFEEMNVVNKYDVIVMNPPFGTGGSTAMKHLAKAAQHLRDGGRIVALIPEGPAADGKFNKWFFDNTATENLVKVAEYGLPNVVFERAGANVRTRIVVIDKINNDEKRRVAVEKPRVEISGETIGEVFDRIEGLGGPPERIAVVTLDPVPDVPEAVKPQIDKLANSPISKAERFELAHFKHTKTGADVFVAKTGTLSNDEYRLANSLARRLGGFYSSFKGEGAIPGLHFKTAEARQSFLELMKGSGLMGTPAEKLSPEKNAPVPGSPGSRYRSHTDTLIERGIQAARHEYKTLSDADSVEAAKAFIGAATEPAAAEAVFDDKLDIPAKVKTAIGALIEIRLGARRFDPALSAEERRAAARQFNRLSERMATRGTELGQAIQGYDLINKLSPDGVLQAAERAVRTRQEKVIGTEGEKTVKEITDAMRKANADAIDEATEALNAATRAIRIGKPIWQRYRDMAARRWVKRIESNLGQLPENPPLAQFVDRLVREVNAQIDKALPRGERPPAPTALQTLAEAVNNREKYAEAWEAARKELADTYGDQPAVLEALDGELMGVLDKPYSQKTLDRALKDAFKQMQTSVREIARMHYKQADALGQTLAQKLALESGLKPEDAQRLAEAVRTRLTTLTAESKKAALSKIGKGKAGVAGRMAGVGKIIDMSNMGAFDQADLLEMLAAELKLPRLTEDGAKKLRDLGERAQKAPEGFQRDRIETDILNELTRLRGIGLVDIATSVYYAHILSGYTTQAVNAISTTLNALADIAIMVARDPKTAKQAIAGIRDGARTGFTHAMAILNNGYAHRTFDQKLPEVSPILEMLSKDAATGPREKALKAYATVLRYVSRSMKAADAVFFHSATEAFHRVAAAKLASAAGKMDRQEFNRKVRDLLQMSPANFEAARKQATAEGLTGLDYQLRVGEIIQQKRGEDVVEAATKFGQEATFNQEPRGYLGVVAKAVGEVSTKFPPLKLFVPFTNIVSNVTNASLNYTPLGAVRAFTGYGRETAPSVEERNTLLIKSIAGTMGMLALLGMGMGDDDEPPLITANGPSDPRARNQLRETGWRPHTIRIGNTYVSYLESPAALAAALVGNYIDAVKYNGVEKKDLGERLAKAIGGVGETITNMSFLSGLADLMDTLRGKKSATDFAANVATSAAIPNLVRQVDRTISPELREGKGVIERVQSAIPILRQALPERQNVIGKPVESKPMQRFGQQAKEDPLWDVIAQKQAWIPEASKLTKLGDRQMTPEEYRRYVGESGPMIERRLRAALPTLQQMTAERADDFVSKVAREERAKVKARMRRGAVTFSQLFDEED